MCFFVYRGGGMAVGGFAAAAALLAGGKVGGLEPFAVLLVSAVVSKILHASVFARTKDDLEASHAQNEIYHFVYEIRSLLGCKKERKKNRLYF